MESRQSSLTWDQLSDDVILYICKYLTPDEGGHRFSYTSRRHYALFNSKHNWRELYREVFGPLDFKDDAKKQYIASYLYNQARDCDRPDKGQILFQQFNEYLKDKVQESWSMFYFAVSHFYGLGVKVDKAKGF